MGKTYRTCVAPSKLELTRLSSCTSIFTEVEWYHHNNSEGCSPNDAVLWKQPSEDYREGIPSVLGCRME